MEPLLRRIRERKLGQWAIAYLAGAWLSLQLTDILGDHFDWPTLVVRGFIVLLAFGLPLTLVVAWYHGEKGEQRVSASELVMIAGILVVAGASVALVGGRGGGVSPDAMEASRETGEIERGGAPRAAAPAEQGSIAVLPFVNMSADAEQEYFSDGMTEEILNALAQVRGLRVAARTSSFAFKGQKVPIDEIAGRLRVATVLEGSVRRAGDSVRITAQLIDAASGYHLWSDTYDRELSDIFAVQEEISRAIVEALRVELAGGEARPIVNATTESPEALNLYLRGRHFWNERGESSLRRAIEFYGKAIEVDPGYARAHAALAETYAVLPIFTATATRELIAQATRAAETALRLDATLPEAHTALAYIRFRGNGDWAGAEQAFLRAIELSPSYATAHQWYGEFLAVMGRGAEAEAELRRAIQLDPLSPIIQSDYGQVLYMGRKFDEAVLHLEPLAEAHPGFPVPHLWLMLSHAAMQRWDEAEASALQARLLTGDPPELVEAVFRAVRDPAHRPAAARLIASRRGETRALSRLYSALWYTLIGEWNPAVAEIERAWREDRTGLEYLRQIPTLDPLRDDPRFQRIVQKLRFP